MSFLRVCGAVLVVIGSSACIVIGSSEDPSPDDPTACVCPSRNGGESDHDAGDHWFNGGEFCGCASVGGAPETTCRNVCDFRGVRFVDSDGVVCSCTTSNAIACSGDADQNGSCSDADADGICDR